MEEEGTYRSIIFGNNLPLGDFAEYFKTNKPSSDDLFKFSNYDISILMRLKFIRNF